MIAAVTKIVGATQHHRQQTVNAALARRIALGSVPGSLLGVWCLHRLQIQLGEEAQHLLVRLHGLMLVLVAVALLLRSMPLSAAGRATRRKSPARGGSGRRSSG